MCMESRQEKIRRTPRRARVETVPDGKDREMKDRYPDEEELERIRTWPHDDFHGLMEFVGNVVEGYGHVKINYDRTKDCGHKENNYELVTGGWSGNETVVSALQDNHLFWAMCWRATIRGGLFIFHVEPKEGTER